MGPQVTAAILIFILLQKSSSPLQSTNLVETNAHLLGLYKKIKEFETNSLLNMKNDIKTLSHKVEDGSCLSQNKLILKQTKSL